MLFVTFAFFVFRNRVFAYCELVVLLAIGLAVVENFFFLRIPFKKKNTDFVVVVVANITGEL